ncbi:MAG: histone deacetylase [Phycisphaeraceae bacterium]|nr:histone deacetylase [Phycisphaeraceae bacterium]
MSTALVYSDRFFEHQTGPGHPEQPARLKAIVEQLRRDRLWDQLHHLTFQAADEKWPAAVHDAAYLRRVRESCAAGRPFVDVMDSAICPRSYEIALLAVGGVLAAVDAVMAQQADNAFCAVRPPGHHCEFDRSMGFCLLNNVAVAAEYLIQHHHLERVAIVDFDVHHGNGTQHLFEQRPDVLFISLHEHPSYLYPGTGFAWEHGQGDGEGATLNLPLPPRSGDDDYRAAFVRKVIPALERFSPQFLLVSAGFDAAEQDPLAHMKVSDAGFAWMGRRLKEAAEELCAGKIVSVLEGGYNLQKLAVGVARYVAVMLQPPGQDPLMALKAGL